MHAMCIAERIMKALPKNASDNKTEKGGPGLPKRLLLYFVCRFVLSVGVIYSVYKIYVSIHDETVGNIINSRK